jgi:hypothetical protein
VNSSVKAANYGCYTRSSSAAPCTNSSSGPSPTRSWAISSRFARTTSAVATYKCDGDLAAERLGALDVEGAEPLPHEGERELVRLLSPRLVAEQRVCASGRTAIR